MKKFFIVPVLLLAGILRFMGFLNLFSLLMSLAIIFALFLLTVKAKKDYGIALLFSLLLAINPWFVFLSREIHKIKVGGFFNTLGFREILDRFLTNYSGVFLFIKGDWPELSVKAISSQGVLYLADLPFLLAGLVYLAGKKRDWFDNLMLCLLILAPLLSILFIKSALVSVSFLMIIPLMFIASLGIKGSLNYFKKYGKPVYFSFLFIIFLCYSLLLARFYDLYFLHQ